MDDKHKNWHEETVENEIHQGKKRKGKPNMKFMCLI